MRREALLKFQKQTARRALALQLKEAHCPAEPQAAGPKDSDLSLSDS